MTQAFRVGLTRDFLRQDGTLSWGDIRLYAGGLWEGMERIRKE